MASVLTSKGRDVTTGLLRAVGTEPKVLAWGVPPSQFTAAVSDIAVFAETAEARVTGTSSQVTTTTANDTYQVVGTLTATGARGVMEVALVDSTTKPTVAAVAAGGVVGSAVATTLNTAATFTPGNGTLIQIRTEVMLVTAGSGSTALTVTRAQNGSSAISTIGVADVVTPGNAPGASAVTGGTVYAHYDFPIINLANGNTLQSTCQVQYQ